MPHRAPRAVFPADDDEVAVVAVLLSIEHGEASLDPEDLSRLASWMGDAPRTIRRHAGGALAAFARTGPGPRARCEALLADAHPHVRWGAAYALGKAGLAGARVIDVAIETLGDEDGDHRWAAASIVTAAARTSPDLRARLRGLAKAGTATTRKMALLCLCDAGERNDCDGDSRAERDGDLFRAALGDEDPYVRLAALTSLARSADRSQETIDAMTQAAASDADPRVRRAATAILERSFGRTT